MFNFLKRGNSWFLFLLLSGNWITQLIHLRRNGERRRFRNLITATGFTVCGHQHAVMLAKLLFCRGALQHFLLRRSLYPVFHRQWSCVSFPICELVWVQSCDPASPAVWNSLSEVIKRHQRARVEPGRLCTDEDCRSSHKGSRGQTASETVHRCKCLCDRASLYHQRCASCDSAQTKRRRTIRHTLTGAQTGKSHVGSERRLELHSVSLTSLTTVTASAASFCQSSSVVAGSRARTWPAGREHDASSLSPTVAHVSVFRTQQFPSCFITHWPGEISSAGARCHSACWLILDGAGPTVSTRF